MKVCAEELTDELTEDQLEEIARKQPEEDADEALLICPEECLLNRTLFSVYGVSMEHPMDWLIFFDPKRPFNQATGFFRIEDYVPGKGANISLSINWEKTPSNNASFAERYCENIAEQYRRQFKKEPYTIESLAVIDYLDVKAAYIVSEHGANLGILRKKATGQVRILQLAFYDEHSGRAVVGSVIGRPGLIRKKEGLLKKFLFTLKCS